MKRYKTLEEEMYVNKFEETKLNEAMQNKVYMLDKTLWFSNSKHSGSTMSNLYLDRNKLKSFTDNPKGKSSGMITSDYDMVLWQDWAKQNKPVKKTSTSRIYLIPRYYNDFYMDEWVMYGGSKKPDELIYVVFVEQGGYTYIHLFTNKHEALHWV